MAGGRPTKYRPEFVEQAEKLCRLGATDVEVADFFKVSTVTLYRWQSRYDEFCKALKVGKDVPDDRVEQSLFQRACGYSHPDMDIRVVEGKIVMTEITKHYPPDPTSMIFWLKNRRRKDWKEKADVEHSHIVNIRIGGRPEGFRRKPIVSEDISEERKALHKELMARAVAAGMIEEVKE